LTGSSGKPLILGLVRPRLEVVLHCRAFVLLIHLEVSEANLILKVGCLFLTLAWETTAHRALTAIIIVRVRLKNRFPGVAPI